MAGLSHFLSARCVHFILKKEELLIEVPGTFVNRAPMSSPEGIGACNPDRSEGIQTIRVLNDFSFLRFRMPPTIPTEGNGVDHLTDPIGLIGGDMLLIEEDPCIFVVLGAEQLVVVCIMQYRCKCNNLHIAASFQFGNPQRIVIYTEGVINVMSVIYVLKQAIDVSNG